MWYLSVEERNKKLYDVFILAVGSQKEIEKKANKYKRNMSIDTTAPEDDRPALPNMPRSSKSTSYARNCSCKNIISKFNMKVKFLV